MTGFCLGTFAANELVFGVPSTESITTGGLAFIAASKGNLIGNVKFEVNHAVTSGGKWKFEDPLTAIGRGV